jgi:hypothetical protein
MEPEGMVHALKKTHRLLKPDGLLIDIQPTPTPQTVEVHSDGRASEAGKLGHRQDWALHKQAHAALAQVVEEGLFVVEREINFPFLYHADTLVTLRNWLAENWENSILDDETGRRVEELLASAGAGSVAIIREPVRMMRLRQVPQQL